MTDRTEAEDHDLQDPLPESSWLWRRVFTFVATLIVFALLIGLAVAADRIVSSVVERIDTMSPQAVAVITVRALGVIEWMFELMFWALLVVATYYMVDPSAEQITKMLQTARLLRAGVQVASRSVETPGRREEARTAGRPPQPDVPEIGDERYRRADRGRGRIDETRSSATRVAEHSSMQSSGLPDDMPDISA